MNALTTPLNNDTPHEWTFLSNHAHVLLVIASDPGVRLRDVATRVGITERAVQRIVKDLETGNYLIRERTGRRNHYILRPDMSLRHPIESHVKLLDLLRMVLPTVEIPTEGSATRGTVGARRS
jgi:DNA-binding IclR family transcriptional regulator